MDEEVTKGIWTLKLDLNPNLIIVKYWFSEQNQAFTGLGLHFFRPQLNLGFYSPAQQVGLHWAGKWKPEEVSSETALVIDHLVFNEKYGTLIP